MYIPHSYKNENIEEVRAFLSANSFGILINQTNGKLWGTHIPIELDKAADGKDILVSHISKANPQWQSFQNEAEVLAIFNGPHSYVSSSWYNHENVPTWNYIAVHVYGKIEIIEGEELIHSLRKLVDKYEQHSEQPITLDSLSESTMRQVKGIVGFKIHITDIQAAYKLSQNRDEEDYHNIIHKLEQHPNSTAIASAMKSKDDFNRQKK